MAWSEDDNLPVLNDVIRSGDAAIIRSTRLQKVRIEPRESVSNAPLHFELPDHLQLDQTSADELEVLIDDMIDKHIVTLRKDIRKLLERALDLS